jgi:hypothetical protein
LQPAGDFAIDDGKQPGFRLDQGHVDTQGGEDARVLRADDASADDGHRLGESGHGQDLVRIVDALEIEGDVGWTVR